MTRMSADATDVPDQPGGDGVGPANSAKPPGELQSYPKWVELQDRHQAAVAQPCANEENVAHWNACECGEFIRCHGGMAFFVRHGGLELSESAYRIQGHRVPVQGDVVLESSDGVLDGEAPG